MNEYICQEILDYWNIFENFQSVSQNWQWLHEKYNVAVASFGDTKYVKLNTI